MNLAMTGRVNNQLVISNRQHFLSDIQLSFGAIVPFILFCLTVSEKSSFMNKFVSFRLLARLGISSLSLKLRSFATIDLGRPEGSYLPTQCALSISMSLGSIFEIVSEKFFHFDFCI